MLSVRDLSVSFSGFQILRDIHFDLKEGDWLMILGPNGSGKTTITNAIAQSIPYTGRITFEGKDVGEMDGLTRAKNIGVLMQNHYVAYNYTVQDIVRLGAYARLKGVLGHENNEEESRMKAALEATGMSSKAQRSVLTLSGGELQRTFLAQVLVQDPKLMILDEPTNHLDLLYQESIFHLIDDWRKKESKAVVSVVHDLRLARHYGTKAILLKEGQIFAQGDMEAVMTPKVLEGVYGLDVYQWNEKLNKKWRRS